MTGFQDKRVAHEGKQHNVASPEKVFRCCPVGEGDWLPGWEYRLIFSQSGFAKILNRIGIGTFSMESWSLRVAGCSRWCSDTSGFFRSSERTTRQPAPSQGKATSSTRRSGCSVVPMAQATESRVRKNATPSR